MTPTRSARARFPFSLWRNLMWLSSYQRSLKKLSEWDLHPSDINMIIKECDYSTNLLRWESTGSAEYPATGGSGQWWINQSKVLSLPELLYWGHDKMTMYELYRMWLAYPIFPYKRSLWREPVGAGAVLGHMIPRQVFGFRGVWIPASDGKPWTGVECGKKVCIFLMGWIILYALAQPLVSSVSFAERLRVEIPDVCWAFKRTATMAGSKFCMLPTAATSISRLCRR